MADDNTGKKKGMHPMAWVGIGCGGVVLIAVVVMALLVGWCKGKVDDFQDNPERVAAEMMVGMNPDWEKVSLDDAAGTMTIREKSTGKERTLGYDAISEGKFSVTSGEGTATIDGSGGEITATTPDGGKTTSGRGGIEQMPEMFVLPGIVKGWVSMMHSEGNGKTIGIVRGESEETLEALEEAFTKAFVEAGFTEVSRASGSTTNISFEKKEAKQNVTLSLDEEADKRVVQLTYILVDPE